MLHQPGRWVGEHHAGLCGACAPTDLRVLPHASRQDDLRGRAFSYQATVDPPSDGATLFSGILLDPEAYGRMLTGATCLAIGQEHSVLWGVEHRRQTTGRVP